MLERLGVGFLGLTLLDSPSSPCVCKFLVFHKMWKIFSFWPCFCLIFSLPSCPFDCQVRLVNFFYFLYCIFNSIISIWFFFKKLLLFLCWDSLSFPSLWAYTVLLHSGQLKWPQQNPLRLLLILASPAGWTVCRFAFLLGECSIFLVLQMLGSSALYARHNGC